MTAATAIDLQGVNYTYGNALVVENVTLRVPRGEYVAMLGPNGGGKTTLLKLLLGLLRPTAGDIAILGQTPAQAAPRLGYMPQFTAHGRDFPITVLETVLLGRMDARSWWPVWASRDVAAAMQSLERVGMAAKARSPLGELSGGQRQRVFVARALAGDPELLLLDEPTASVDPEGRTSLHELLGELAKDMTVVMVSHDISVISRHVTAVICVNRQVHYHPRPELTPEMFEMMYHCGHGDCPVELFAHGLPHRVAAPHGDCKC